MNYTHQELLDLLTNKQTELEDLQTQLAQSDLCNSELVEQIEQLNSLLKEKQLIINDLEQDNNQLHMNQGNN